MRTLLANRIKCVVALLVSSGAATVLHFAWGRDQDRWDYMTGWTLLALMLVLAAFSARKRLSFLSFFSAAAWLQFHLYAGCFAALLFVIHIQFRWPIGWFEVGLTGFYAVVTVSGIVGIFLSRVFAKRMGARGGDVLFEQVPAIRRRLREEAESLAVGSVEKAESGTLANFYARELHDFFSRHRNSWAHLIELRSPLNNLQEKISELERFLDTDELEILKRIDQLVKQKDGLDYQYTLQWALRLWLFVHIPFTWGLLIWSFAHVVLVYGFSGGVGVD